MRTWRAEGASADAVEESSCRVCQDLGSDRSNQTQGPTVQFVFCSGTDQVLSVTIASAGHGNGRCRSRPVGSCYPPDLGMQSPVTSDHHDLACLRVPVHLGQAGQAREFEARAAGALTWQRTPLGHPLEALGRRLAGGVGLGCAMHTYAYTHTTVTTYSTTSAAAATVPDTLSSEDPVVHTYLRQVHPKFNNLRLSHSVPRVGDLARSVTLRTLALGSRIRWTAAATVLPSRLEIVHQGSATCSATDPEATPDIPNSPHGPMRWGICC